jgi:Holliday junction resolvase
MRVLGLANPHRPRPGSGGHNRGKGKLAEMPEETARRLFDKFKKSKVGLSTFGPRQGFSDEGLAKVFKKYFPDEYDILQEAKRSRKDLWYRRGRSFEYTVRNYLVSKGWFVLRSPQSKSPIDLIALRTGAILLIQCKLGASTLLLAEKRAIVDLANSTGGRPILAHRKLGHGIFFRQIEVEGYLDVAI